MGTSKVNLPGCTFPWLQSLTAWPVARRSRMTKAPSQRPHPQAPRTTWRLRSGLAGACEHHGTKSRAGTRAQAMAPGPHAVPRGPPQTNPTEPLIVRGSGAQMLLKHKTSPKGPGRERWTQWQPHRPALQAPRTAARTSARVCELKPHSAPGDALVRRAEQVSPSKPSGLWSRARGRRGSGETLG